jgi:hypothetical protein
MANGDSVPIPLWMRVFLQVGFPTGVAILLLAALLGWMPSPMITTLNRLEYQAWYQGVLLRQICYRLSDKLEDRRSCEPWKDTGP